MDLLESRSERTHRPPASRGTRALILASLAVAGAGVLAVPNVAAPDRDGARRAPSPRATAGPAVTAITSGSTVTGGRLRLWLVLQGPPSARLSGARAWLPGSVVEVEPRAPAFSARGFSALQLDVEPQCPAGVAGLPRAHLHLQVDEGSGPVEVEATLDGDRRLASAVRERCAELVARRARQGPPARSGRSPTPGVLRALVDVQAPANGEVVVRSMEPGPGLQAEVAGGLPLRVPSTSRRTVVVDLRARRCLGDRPPEQQPPPFVLEFAPGSEVEPVLNAELAARLSALRRAACRP